MDDSDYVCPLCCEELDISDREFYPCKCGYQVCMWCWHRIREQESGLCPACRTPYGEDPHQFTAVDVEEVLKANKEKEAAAKRERQRSSTNSSHHDDMSNATSLNATSSSSSNASHLLSNNNSSHHHLHSLSSTIPEAPKDRSVLANMRVIRRNLVYAVGLPPHAATEEILKRPEYFGQYGRIAKIVINRTQVAAAVAAAEAAAARTSSATSSGESRRASASAYVTFVHKEDTLACILALDGFYLDGRNIRASYGTSKYCSAFIKSVRCNNPECTYLHEMGAPEDTFTKQEIQAGYVTSGRDVLARQQQIVAEQLRLGQGANIPRKRVGGGGPSGTGRAASSPIFPVPEYDEPSKPSAPLVPPPVGMTRSSTTAAATSLNPANIAAKLGRSSSIGVTVPVLSPGNKSPTFSSTAGPGIVPPHPSSTTTAHRKTHSGPLAVSNATGAATTAAAVVASGRSVHKQDLSADSPATLTPLTPLKRTTAKSTAGNSRSVSVGVSSSEGASEKTSPLRNGTNHNNSKKLNGRSASTGIMTGAPTLPSSQHHSTSNSQQQQPASASSIGGDVIGPPNLKPRSASMLRGLGGENSTILDSSPASSLGGLPIGIVDGNATAIGISASGSSDSLSRSSALGGDVFTGELPSSSKSAIGSNAGHKWNAVGPTNQYVAGGGIAVPNGPPTATSGFLNNDSYTGGVNLAVGTLANPVGGRGSVIGPRPSSIENHYASSSSVSGFNGNSSSALASILGINLPTGSGSLQETSSLWSSAPGPSPLAALNSTAIPTQDFFGNYNSRDHQAAINGGSSLIGGVPIGGASSSVGFPSGNVIGGATVGGSNGSGMSDIALLQSLLPGVHITSGGSDAIGFHSSTTAGRSGMGGWATAPSAGPSAVGLGPSGLQGDPIPGGWNRTMSHSTSSSMGAIGQNVGGGGHQGQRRGPGIW